MTVIIQENEVDTLEELGLRPEYEPDDPNAFSHIFRGEENDELWEDGMDAQALVNLARDLQLEIVALCGFVLIPSKNPMTHDLCQKCAFVWNGLT